MSVEVRESKRGARELRCPFCHESVGPEETGAACSTCRAQHHVECFAEGRGCAACRGLDRVRVERAGSFRRRARRWARLVLAALLLEAALLSAYASRARLFVEARTERADSACGGEFGPEALVVVYHSVATTLRAPDLAPYVTARTLDVLALEGFDAERACLGTATPLYRTIQDRESALVVVGGREKVHVVWNQGWLVDRALADEPTTTCGMSIHLPARLALARGNRWSCGTLSARIEREGCSTDPTTSLGSALERVYLPGAAGGLPATLFVGGDWNESCAHAFVVMHDGDKPLHYELHGPPDRVDEVRRVLHASLETLRPQNAFFRPSRLFSRLEKRTDSFQTLHVRGSYSVEKPASLDEELFVRVFEPDNAAENDICQGYIPKVAISLLKVYPSDTYFGAMHERFEHAMPFLYQCVLRQDESAPDRLGEVGHTLVAWRFVGSPRNLAVAIRARARAAPEDVEALRSHLLRLVDSFRIESTSLAGSRHD